MEPEQLAPDGGLDEAVDVPSNVLLLRREGVSVLVDAGSGRYAPDWPGGVDRLGAALQEAGLSPSGIDLVLLTHLDFDHCGGCLDIPRARVLAPADAEPSGRAGREVLDRMGADGRLEMVDPGAEPLEGVVLRSAPGHRGGHCIVEVGDGLVHLADVVHHPVHVGRPEADRVFDEDAGLALETRRRVLDEMAARAVVVTASHIEGPGRIAREQDGLRWQPL
jgi:glyoxylase-like metal-dependent hydrolase (beta-lactamase superfamily II)